ncbi:unnamed protein product [Aphis gossypii]|uniref:Uncharacterized protein n=1 Tax=Aphis gossypii TaxID=80765 RepID=A0A9P0NFT6_APHGO|nr:unnamed protein product [Aphis gossypii]
MIYFIRSHAGEDIDIVETLKEIRHRKRDGHTFNFAGRTSFVWNSTYGAAGVRKVSVRFDERLSREWRGNALYRQTGRLVYSGTTTVYSHRRAPNSTDVDDNNNPPPPSRRRRRPPPLSVRQAPIPAAAAVHLIANAIYFYIFPERKILRGGGTYTLSHAHDNNNISIR